MTKQQFEGLRKGDKINHKHYGICTVEDYVHDFGPTIIPDSKAGKLWLQYESGMPVGTPLLETSARLITSYVVLPRIKPEDPEKELLSPPGDTLEETTLVHEHTHPCKFYGRVSKCSAAFNFRYDYH